jgi:ankyrin repeat protein
MPTNLPERPNLRHLKEQAKDLLKRRAAQSLSDAQFQIARLYNFASWPKLKACVEGLVAAGKLKSAIDANNFERVKQLMTADPGLHRAPLGYGKDGPLTWVAECRVPWEPPGEARLAMARWMIENGSDVHQGGDGPLMRAALNGDRVAMMELLVAHGAHVNARWHGEYPILFAACETVNPVSLRWLLEHGADPNCGALDYVIGSYGRSADLPSCIDILLEHGATTKYDQPGVMPILRGRLANVDGLTDRRYPELDFGTTGARMLTLRGATLLHVAAEYQNLAAVRLLLDAGANVNAQALIDNNGVGGQTAIFHAATQFDAGGYEVVKLLLERGADVSTSARLPGHYESEGEIVEATVLGYALRFPGGENRTVALLRERGAPQ